MPSDDDYMTDDDNVSVTYMQKEVCNQDLLALGASSVGFISFGIMELVYSFISHSLCLMVDSVVALMDASIYIMSFAIELYKSCNQGTKFSFQFLLFTEVYFPLFCTLVLIAFMMSALVQSIPVLQHPDDKSDVEISYVFIFGSINLVIDLICASFYVPEVIGNPCFQKIKMEKNIGEPQILPAATPLIEPQNPISMEIDDKNFIMVSACIHLFSDILYAMLEIIAACLSYFWKLNANLCDASAAIASAIVVIGVCIYFLIELWHNYKRIEGRRRKLLSPDEVSCFG